MVKRRPRRLRRPRRADLNVPLVLSWLDDHFARFGDWPRREFGEVAANSAVKWRDVDNALRVGLRGLEGGSSLTKLLLEARGVVRQPYQPRLTEAMIAGWACKEHQEQRKWPTVKSGPVTAAPAEVWANINQALRDGRRGLPGGDSLAQLLERRFGVRNHLHALPLTLDQILLWIDGHHEETGKWPQAQSGAILRAPGESWAAIERALVIGGRGLPGGNSLAQVLSECRGVRNRARLPPFREDTIVGWARAHYARKGKWPHAHSGPIPESPGETWDAVDKALLRGQRGLHGHCSLHRLLVARGCKASETAADPRKEDGA